MLIVAWPTPSTAFSGYPSLLICSEKPVGPVNWTFKRLPESEIQHIITDGSVVSGSTERYGIRSSSLIIYKVQSDDVGSYNCCDANGDVFTYTLTVIGQ